MATNQQQQNEKEQEKNSSALFQKIDLLSSSKKEDISTTEAKSNMSSTKNTKDNRQVVLATYTTQSLFEIPKGLDLEDKSVVEGYGIKWNELIIDFVNGKSKTIYPTWDASESDFKRPDDFRITSVKDVCYEYDEEESEHSCYGCEFEGKEDCFMIDDNGYMYCYSCVYLGKGKFSKERAEEGCNHYVKVWCIKSDNEDEEEKYECADCKEKYNNGELFVWDMENGNEENAEELMEDCELRTDYKRCEGCYDNFCEKVIEFLEKKEKNMEEEEEEEEDENEKKNVLVNQVNELCVIFGVQNTLSYYEGVLADEEKKRAEEFIQINGRLIKRDKIKPKNKCKVCEKAPVNCSCYNGSDSEEEEEEEKEEEIFNCDECNINLLRDKNGILKCVRMYENNKDIDYCKECYFKLYEEEN